MISLFSPFLPKELGKEIQKVLDSGFINRGEKALEFERLLKKTFNWPYVHSVNSGTSALKLALKIAGIGKKEEVITTPWTMVATNTSILDAGGKPVFADIKYDTLNIDPDSIKDKITEKTKALMIVHYGGYPCNLKEIYRIGRNNDLIVIQDCAQALGAKYKKFWIGSFGEFNCFSFQTVKIITTGDGGCLSTICKSIYEEAVKRSWFGIDKKKRKDTLVGKFPKDIDVLGFKHSTTDINAVMGLVGLKYIKRLLKKRKRIARRYLEELGNLRKIKLLSYSRDRESSNWIFPIHVKERNSFALAMKRAGIEVSKLYERNDKYSLFRPINKDLENIRRVEEDIIHIPLHSNLEKKEIDYIIKNIKKWDRK